MYGAFRMFVKMLLMWDSNIQIDGGGNSEVGTSVLEIRNLVVLRVCSVSHIFCLMLALVFYFYFWFRRPLYIYNLFLLQKNSVIHSNANLGVYGQGRLRLTGPGDAIKGQRLFLSLFYNIDVRIYIFQPKKKKKRFKSIGWSCVFSWLLLWWVEMPKWSFW